MCNNIKIVACLLGLASGSAFAISYYDVVDKYGSSTVEVNLGLYSSLPDTPTTGTDKEKTEFLKNFVKVFIERKSGFAYSQAVNSIEKTLHDEARNYCKKHSLDYDDFKTKFLDNAIHSIKSGDFMPCDSIYHDLQRCGYFDDLHTAILQLGMLESSSKGRLGIRLKNDQEKKKSFLYPNGRGSVYADAIAAAAAKSGK